MPNLLIVAHCPSENTEKLLTAAKTGVNNEAFESIEVRIKRSPEATPDDVLWADGICLGTTENFGYMAGLTKDFFERIYYPCLEAKQGTPFALYIRAGLDGQGTITSIERIVTGLRWSYIRPPVLLHGEWKDSFCNEVEELGMYLAAGLETGIF